MKNPSTIRCVSRGQSRPRSSGETAQFVATVAAEKVAAINTAEFFGEPPQPDDDIA